MRAYTLLSLLITSCKERDIVASRESISNPDVRRMAEEGYSELAPEVEEKLPSFDEAYAKVSSFYENLPWGESQPSTATL